MAGRLLPSCPPWPACRACAYPWWAACVPATAADAWMTRPAVGTSTSSSAAAMPMRPTQCWNVLRFITPGLSMTGRACPDDPGQASALSIPRRTRLTQVMEAPAPAPVSLRPMAEHLRPELPAFQSAARIQTMRNLVLLFALAAAGGFVPHDVAAQGPASVTPVADVTFSMRTEILNGQMVFVGNAGTIKDEVNPDLRVAEGAVVAITITNNDGAMHDIAVPEFNAQSDQLVGVGSATTIVFRASKSGTFEYICTIPGHKLAGMAGNLIVGDVVEEASTAIDVAKDPAEVGTPVGNRAPEHITYDLLTTEVEGRLSDGSTYRYWTFDNTVPGPLLRIRQGDTVTINLKNAEDSVNIHSVDFHSVTGPGGGAAVTQVRPGETKSFTFKALHPGLFVYHCATPMIAHHISNGMYGMILVEPEGGLPKVDQEFYVMQGELYTAQKHGSRGLQEFSVDKLLDEKPEHLMFNGSMDALTKTFDMNADVGEEVRIFFGVGGPNLISSFHLIGEVFDRVYDLASFTSPPLTDVQTTLVPPGGATMVEFKVDYPGKYILVDHALSRAEKGLVGFLTVNGEADPAIFNSDEPIDASSGH